MPVVPIFGGTEILREYLEFSYFWIVATHEHNALAIRRKANAAVNIAYNSLTDLRFQFADCLSFDLIPKFAVFSVDTICTQAKGCDNGTVECLA